MPVSLVIIPAKHTFNTVRSCSSEYSFNDVWYCEWLFHCCLTWQRCSSNIRDNWYGEKFTSTIRCKHIVKFSGHLWLCCYQVWPSLDLLERQFAWCCDPSSTKLCCLCWYSTYWWTNTHDQMPLIIIQTDISLNVPTLSMFATAASAMIL